jgi:hypothetical protein
LEPASTDAGGGGTTAGAGREENEGDADEAGAGVVRCGGRGEGGCVGLFSDGSVTDRAPPMRTIHEPTDAVNAFGSHPRHLSKLP